MPLINIVFLLLIFFLIAGTIAPRPDFAIAYPHTEMSPATRPPPEALHVSAGGYLSFRGVAVDLDGVPAMIAASGAGAAAPLPVVVDRLLPGADLSPVMETLTRAGVRSVRLITLKERAR